MADLMNNKRLIALGIMDDGEIEEVKLSISKLSNNIKVILESEGVEAAYKVLDNEDEKTVMLLSADVAESVLYIYEQEYPNDNRVRNCIEGSRRYCRGEISKDELEVLKKVAASASASYASASAAAASASVSACYA